jgi:hypothetical protein
VFCVVLYVEYFYILKEKKIVYDPEMWKLLLCLTFIVSVVGNVWLWEKNEKREHCDNFFYKYIGGETEIK